MAEGLLVIGAGGHGKVVADAAVESGRWQRVAFVDDRFPQISEVMGLPVVGDSGSLAGLRATWGEAVVAIGDSTGRLQMLDELERLGYLLASIVHPGASVSRSSVIGPGTVVFAKAAINAETRMGRGCIVNTGATVDHDCQLGDGVHVCPGVNLAGNVSVGARTWIGIGSAVRQGISIGQNVMVGAGSVVVRSIPDGVTVFGVPARVRP